MNYYRLCQFKGFQYIQQVQKIQTILHWMEKQSDYTMYKIDNNSLLQTMQWIGCIHTRMHARTHTHAVKIFTFKAKEHSRIYCRLEARETGLILTIVGYMKMKATTERLHRQFLCYRFCMTNHSFSCDRMKFSMNTQQVQVLSAEHTEWHQN